MPNERIVAANGSNVTAGINLLIGIWVFVSPWIYGAAVQASAWNSWIVGALVALFALIRWGSPVGARGLGWANMLLGAWLFLSPWIFGYTAYSGRFINSLCAGVLIFVLSLYGASAAGRRMTGAPTHT